MSSRGEASLGGLLLYRGGSGVVGVRLFAFQEGMGFCFCFDFIFIVIPVIPCLPYIIECDFQCFNFLISNFSTDLTSM